MTSFLRFGRTKPYFHRAALALGVQTSDSSSSSRFASWVGAAAATTALGTTILLQQQERRKAECCGIAAVVGSGNYDARTFLLEGLTVLKNRGYDSAGLATVDPKGGPLAISKFAGGLDADSAIACVRDHSGSADGPVGMAHTRWATHGPRTDENAHPHKDSSGRIAIVHNGTLHNARALRQQLQNAGHLFESQTDSEVIAKLIGHYYNPKDSASSPNVLKAATEKALSHCEGTWGLVVMSRDHPDELVVASSGSPLVIGVTEGGVQPTTYIASEVDAFRKYTQTFVALRDGEVGVVKATGPSLDAWSSLRLQEAPKDSEDEMKAVLPAGFKHWTLREIYDQPEAVGRALCFGGRLGSGRVLLGGLDGFDQDILKNIKHLVLSACATSLHAAQYGALLMRELGSFSTITAIEAASTTEHDFAVKNAGCCVVSQSGETKDVARVVEAAQEASVPCMGVINEVGSTIARAVDCGVYAHAGRERAVVSTKSFTAQVASLALMGLWFRQLRGGERKASEAEDVRESLMRLPMTAGAALRTHDQCKEVAKRLAGKKTCFVIGKGFAEPVAKQGALKLLELGCLHAEGCGAGALKHGCLALVEDKYTVAANHAKQTGKKLTKKMVTECSGTPVIAIVLDDQHSPNVLAAAQAVKARGGDLIIITDNASLAQGLDPNPIVVPRNGPLTALGAVIPLQLIAYEVGLLRGINPDTPRNLSKAVLVD